MAQKKKFIEASMSGRSFVAEDGKRYEMAMVPYDEAQEFRAQQGQAGLIGRVMARLRPKYRDVTSDAGDERTTDIQTQSGSLFGSTYVAQAYYEQMKSEQKRSALYEDYKRMDMECVIARRALNVTVANVFTSREGDEESWEIKSDDSGLQQVLEDMDKRVDMHDYAPKHCRTTLRYGDGFTELVVDPAMTITRLKNLNPRYMVRNEDGYGRLMADAAFYMQDESADVKIVFPYFQVVHTRYDHDLENRYGTSFYFTARKPWRQIEMMKDGVVIKRLTKSVKRYAYMIPVPPGTPMEERERIKNRMKDELRRSRYVDSGGSMDRRKRPPIEEDDVFIVFDKDEQGADVKMFDPGGMNDNMLDVHYFRDEIIVAVGVPPAYLGLDKEVRGRAHLAWIDIEYARMLRSVQKMMASWQRRIYDMQLFLLNMDSGKDAYKVVYPPISFVDERMKREVQQLQWQVAVIANREMGVPVRWVLEKIVELPEKEIEIIMQGWREPEPAQMPGTKETRLTRERVYGDMKMHNALTDIRDRLRYAMAHGLNKELVA